LPEIARVRSAPQKEAEEFNAYLHAARQGLLDAINEPEARFQPLLDAVASLKVERVLDVGCGVGQVLYPFVALKGAVGVGLDPTAHACRMGRDFYTEHVESARVQFVCGLAEELPFPSASFDVVNCGLALPYMNNARAIEEVARVLRPGGVFLLRIHHARYYLRDLWQGITGRRLLSLIHAGRVLAVGSIYHLTGRQTDTRLFGKETFQTRWLLHRELSRRGLKLTAERADSNPQTPAFVIYKEQ
jgi:SAM-dependent methyltransferase